MQKRGDYRKKRQIIKAGKQTQSCADCYHILIEKYFVKIYIANDAVG